MVHFLLVPYLFASCTGKNRKVKFHQCSVYREQPEKLFQALKFLNKSAFEDEFKNVDGTWLVELLYLRVCENVLLVINDSLMHMGKPRVQVKRFWLRKPQGSHPGVFNLKKLLKKLYHVTGIILLAQDTGDVDKRKRRHKNKDRDTTNTKENSTAVEETNTVSSSDIVIGDQKYPKSSDEALTSDYGGNPSDGERKEILAEIIETQPEPEPEPKPKSADKIPKKKNSKKSAAEVSDDPAEFDKDDDDDDDDDDDADDADLNDEKDDDLDILDFKEDDVNSDASLNSEEKRMWDTDIKHREKEDDDDNDDPFA